MERYYLVSYLFRRHGRNEIVPRNAVTLKTAAAWILETLVFEDGTYTLVSHTEITKDEYEALRGVL